MLRAESLSNLLELVILLFIPTNMDKGADDIQDEYRLHRNTSVIGRAWLFAAAQFQ